MEKKLQSEKSDEQRLSIEVEQLEKSINDLENAVKHYRELRYGLDLKVNPLNVNYLYYMLFIRYPSKE